VPVISKWGEGVKVQEPKNNNFTFFGTRACTANIAMDRRYCFKEWVNQYRLKNKQTRLENEGPNSRAGQSLVIIIIVY